MQTETQQHIISSYNNDEENVFAWDDFCCEIGLLIKKSKTFFVLGSSMGWQKLTGHRIVTTNDAQNFLQKILPKTSDLRIDVYKSDKPGAICEMTIYHHDAPTGEFRTIYSLAKAKRLKLVNQ